MSFAKPSCLLFCLLLLAADKPKEVPAKSGLDALQGTWEWESLEAEGVKVPKKEYEGITTVIKNDRMTMNRGKEKETVTIAVDSSKSPAWIQTTSREGDVLLGIYKLEGDKLTICISKEGKVRPTEFKTKKDQMFGMFVLKRKMP